MRWCRCAADDDWLRQGPRSFRDPAHLGRVEHAATACLGQFGYMALTSCHGGHYAFALHVTVAKRIVDPHADCTPHGSTQYLTGCAAQALIRRQMQGREPACTVLLLTSQCELLRGLGAYGGGHGPKTMIRLMQPSVVCGADIPLLQCPAHTRPIGCILNLRCIARHQQSTQNT